MKIQEKLLTSQELSVSIMEEIKDSPPGYDNTKLIELMLKQWELHIRMDQNRKNFEMTMKAIKDHETKANESSDL